MFRKFCRLPRYILVYLHKCVLCKWQSGASIRQMFSINNIQSSLSSLTRSRKLVFGVLLILLIILYLGPNLFDFHGSKRKTGVSDTCLEEKLSKYKTAADNFDVGINHIPIEEEETHVLPYVGNGKIAASFGTKRGFFIRLNRALSQEVPFNPIIEVLSENHPKEAYLVDFQDAFVQRTQILHVSGGCVTIGSRMYAHRTRPSILIQTVRVFNPTISLKVFMLKQERAQNWADVQTSQNSATGRTGSVDFSLSVGLVPLSDYPDKVVAVAIATLIPDQQISVKPGAHITLHFKTVVHHSNIMSKTEAPAEKERLRNLAKKEMEEVLRLDSASLKQEHTTAWRKLWQSGFSISLSKAADSLNGDKINSTLYYVLSNVPAPLHDVTTTQAEKVNIWKVLYYPDRCYDAYSTLFADKLWVDVTTEYEVASLVTTWMITLESHGCASMIKSGAEGVLQAMLLSFGALQFRDERLEFNMHPQDLHRDFFFHRINYGNNTHVNISVEVGEDNKAVLYVALDRNDKPYYACDAGCIDPPVPLGKDKQSFLVKLTKPITAILYITPDKQHMEELKHAIHTKEIVEAPAHEHHVIALHKHGHHFGGLPTIFWVSIVFLILIFHLFLFKLIYNEYCSAQDRYTRGKYNL